MANNFLAWMRSGSSPLWGGLLLFGLLLGSPVAVPRAIDEGLDWQRCEGPLLQLPPPLEAGGEVRLAADDARLDPQRRSIALRGEVVVEQAGVTLEADRVTFDDRTRRLLAEGAVRLTSSEMRLLGERAELELESERGVVTLAHYRLLQQRARGSAEQVELLDRQRSRLHEVTYTTCAPDDPGWLLRAGRLELDRERGIGVARGASLTFYGVPLLYTPYVQFPIDERRMSGLLVPTFGYSRQRGADIALPYYWNIAPQIDATLQPRLMSRRGVLLGGELRHLGSFGYSELGVEWMPKDDGRASGVDASRYALGLVGDGSLPWGGRYRVDAQYTSDDAYLDDFGESLAVSSQTHLARRALIDYRGLNWQLQGRLEYFQTLDTTIAARHRPYARLPQLRYHVERQPLPLGLFAALQSEAVAFERAHGVTGQRIDLKPTLSYPLNTAWGFLTPTLALRHTAYWLEDPAAERSSRAGRTLPSFTVDSGLFLERSLEWSGREVTQTLEPRLYYLYTPYREQGDLPLFDTAPLDFGFAALFRDNRFSGADRVADANQLALALTSRLLDASSGEERLRLGVGGVAYFADRRVQWTPGEVASARGSTLVGEAAARFGQAWSVAAALEWDPQEQPRNYERAALRLSYRDHERGLVNLSYRYDERHLEQGDLSFRQALGEQWDLVGRWNYSLRDKETRELFGGVEYSRCCWTLRTLARRQVSSVGKEPDLSLMLQLELKGLAGIGNKLDQFLQRGILGYEVDK